MIDSSRIGFSFFSLSRSFRKASFSPDTRVDRGEVATACSRNASLFCLRELRVVSIVRLGRETTPRIEGFGRRRRRERREVKTKNDTKRRRPTGGESRAGEGKRSRKQQEAAESACRSAYAAGQQDFVNNASNVITEKMRKHNEDLEMRDKENNLDTFGAVIKSPFLPNGFFFM